MEYADVAPLLYLKLALEDNKTMYGIKHLLVDEMQDYTPIQYKVLAKLFPCRKTILGDAKQSVNPYSSTTCEQIQRVLVGSEVMKLCKVIAPRMKSQSLPNVLPRTRNWKL